MRLFNSKQERWLFFLAYLMILSAEVNFVTTQEPSLKLAMQFLINGLLITYLFSLLYIAIRNYMIRKRIVELKYGDNMEKYVDYISLCVAQKPNLIWLRNEKVIALALAGRVNEFEAERNALLNCKRNKKIDYEIMERLHSLFELLNGSTPEEIRLDTKKRTFLEKALRLVYWSGLAEESSAVTDLANELMQCKFVLYQAIAAMALAKSCLLMKDEQKMKEYVAIALKKAPSPEIQSCIRKQFQGTD